jgi:transcriptional regulator of heat shock response
MIESYIKTAEPVDLNFGCLGELDVSGATIRNELSELESICHLTHHSAGRY